MSEIAMTIAAGAVVMSASLSMCLFGKSKVENGQGKSTTTTNKKTSGNARGGKGKENQGHNTQNVGPQSDRRVPETTDIRQAKTQSPKAGSSKHSQAHNAAVEVSATISKGIPMENYDDSSSDEEVVATEPSKVETKDGTVVAVKTAGANIKAKSQENDEYKPESLLAVDTDVRKSVYDGDNAAEIDLMLKVNALDTNGGQSSDDDGDLGIGGYDATDNTGVDEEPDVEPAADPEPVNESPAAPEEPVVVPADQLRSLLTKAPEKEDSSARDESPVEPEENFDSEADKIASRFGGSRASVRRQKPAA